MDYFADGGAQHVAEIPETWETHRSRTAKPGDESAMRVLFVDLEREWRGGQSQALLTLRGLRQRGHDAHLVTADGSALAARAQAASIPAHAVGPRARRAEALFLLRRLLTRERFAIVHANEPHALTAAWLAGAHKKAAMVVSRRVAYPLKQGAISRR